jgi:quercetin dioxygenase-like cupin family protein
VANTSEGTVLRVIAESSFETQTLHGHVMTVVVELAPGSSGTPPHRHSGPVVGYMLDGQMEFELEGDRPYVITAGDAFSEPGGDVIHYRAANHLADCTSRFVAVMWCVPGQPMLSVVPEDELLTRQDRRHPDAADFDYFSGQP